MKSLSTVILCLFLYAGLAFVGTAQRPDAPPYGEPGPFSVGTRDFTVDETAQRPLSATIWYPASSPGDFSEAITYRQGLFTAEGSAFLDAPANIEDGPYPLVIFSHGNSGLRFQSIFLTEHLASYGFVVIAIDHPGNTFQDAMAGSLEDNFAETFALRPDDITRTIAYAEDNETELIDIERIALIGHSLGGWTALTASGLPINMTQVQAECAQPTLPDTQGLCFQLDFASESANLLGMEAMPDGAWPVVEDPRIRATVALAPWNGLSLDRAALSEHTIPTMFIAGTADEVTPPERDSLPVYNALFQATPKALVTLANAGHYIFVNTCPPSAVAFDLYDSCSDDVWDMQRAHDLINHFTTAFLLSAVNDDEAATVALEESQNDYRGVDYQLIDREIEQLRPEILATYPHDPNAWTQGLLVHEGLLYESTGRNGESSLREIVPETGEILRQVNINEQFYAEGLAKVDERLIQLTYVSQVAFDLDFETFAFNQAFGYVGEGWGLCYDGEFIYMSNGSSSLARRDPTTFEVLEQIPVTMRGEPVLSLNELECVGDLIYANIWPQDHIVVIEKASGEVTARIDGSGLLADEASANPTYLNGIAHVEGDIFYITGKLWPSLFEVRFVPVEDD